MDNLSSGPRGAVPQLVRLGLTNYQAKVYNSLVSLGVGSVSEIHRSSRVPRTKVYEALEDLLRKGALELQPGRPALYRAVYPKTLVARLVEEYKEAATEAEGILEGEYQAGKTAEHDVAWTVKGDRAIRRKLADLISSSKNEVLLVETWPPTFTRSVLALLKAVALRGVKVRSVALLVKEGAIDPLPDADLVEYRRFPSPLRSNQRSADEDLIIPLSLTFESPYGLAVVDSRQAFVMIAKPGDEAGSVGLSAAIPGVPMLLSIMFQQFIVSRTRRINP